jgi:hypothetical protein
MYCTVHNSKDNLDVSQIRQFMETRKVFENSVTVVACIWYSIPRATSVTDF